jgi:hypothetical protein
MMPRTDRPRGARRGPAFLALSALVVVVLASPRVAGAESDPAALALADRVMTALGGQAAWDRTGYIAFDFVVSRRDTVVSRRSLAWDKASGRIHLALTDAKGRQFAVWTDLAHEDGVVLVDGAPADSATHAQWLARAHAIWINDTYWLLMPFKLRDPGVTLTALGADSTGRGQVIELAFAGVGLTPGDRYRVHVDDASGWITGWEMLLQGSKDGRWKPVLWTGWRPFGELILADVRYIPDDQVVLTFEHLTTATGAPPGAFDPPAGR